MKQLLEWPTGRKWRNSSASYKAPDLRTAAIRDRADIAELTRLIRAADQWQELLAPGHFPHG